MDFFPSSASTVTGMEIIASDGTSVILPLSIMTRRAPLIEHIWRSRPSQDLKIKIGQSALDLKHYADFVLQNVSIDMSATLDIWLLDSLLRMSRAFGDKDLQMLIVAGLQRRYPTTLKSFDEQMAVEESGGMRQHFDVLALIRSHGLIGAEPAVWYKICRHYSLREIHEGVLRVDGSLSKMAYKDQMFSVTMKDALMNSAFVLGYRWMARGYPRPRECSEKAKCTEFSHKLRDDYWGPFQSIQPFDPWEPYWSTQLCSFCSTTMHNIHTHGRGELWKQLPKYFESNAWEDLIDRQEKTVNRFELLAYDYVE